MSEIVTIYFNRDNSTIDGQLSVKVYDPATQKERYLFEKLPARSGQRGHTNTSWTTGKSPVPYGRYFLWLSPNNPGTWAGQTGIGEFYPISSSEKDRIVIRDAKGHTRTEIGLHPENGLPGSAGCIVLLNDTPVRKAAVAALFKFLQELGKTQKTVHIVVL